MILEISGGLSIRKLTSVCLSFGIARVVREIYVEEDKNDLEPFSKASKSFFKRIINIFHLEV